MKKITQIFLVAVGVVIVFRAPQTTPSFKSKQTTLAPGTTDGRG